MFIVPFYTQNGIAVGNVEFERLPLVGEVVRLAGSDRFFRCGTSYGDKSVYFIEGDFAPREVHLTHD